MKKVLALICVLSLVSFAEGEQKLNKGNKKIMASSPLFSGNGGSLEKGKLTTSFKTIYFNKNNLYSGSDKKEDEKNREMKIMQNVFAIRYGLGKGFDIRAAIPVFSKKANLLTSPKSKETELKNTGLGDIKIFTRYSLKSPKKGDSYFAAIDLGLNLPTGNTDKIFSFNTAKGEVEQPKNKPDGMQLGDGSFDPMIQVAFTKILKKSRLDSSLLYTLNQKGDNEFERGDKLKYNLAYSYAVNKSWDLQAELNGMYLQKNKKSGKEVENSGGNIVYITPGVHSKIGKLKILGGVQIPVYRNLNGEQLISDYKIISKISYMWK